MQDRRIPVVMDAAVPHSPDSSAEQAAGGASAASVEAAAVRPDSVPLMDPRRVYEAWGPAAEQDVLAILRSHAYVKGRHVEAFEQEFAEYVGVGHAVAVDSCTDALYLVLRAILEGRPENRREVILPTFTFVATAGAVVNAGGRPVFADVDPHTHNLAQESVASLLTDRTAAVIPVHIFGNPVDPDAMREVVGSRDVRVIEDAAQAIHATWDGRRAGSLADAAAFSFYPSKNLGAAGDGGILTTDDDALASTVAALRDHGQYRKMYDHALVGTNSRMDEIQAAVLRRKLPHIDAWTAARRDVAERYDRAFRGTSVRPQHVPDGAVSAYHLYTVCVEERDALREALGQRRISSGVYYPLPLHRQSCFTRFDPDPCPVADRLSEEVLSLPCFPGLTRPEQDLVIDAVREVLGV